MGGAFKSLGDLISLPQSGTKSEISILVRITDESTFPNPAELWCMRRTERTRLVGLWEELYSWSVVMSRDILRKLEEATGLFSATLNSNVECVELS